MTRFAAKIETALRGMSPLQVAYALGIRGRSAEKVAARISSGRRLSARKMTNLIEAPADFASREDFGALNHAARAEIASILNKRTVSSLKGTSECRPGSVGADLQKRRQLLLFEAARRLYANRALDYLASQRGYPPRAVIDYVESLRSALPPEVIKQVFPEGYLFKEYFFWIDFPLKDAYVFKF